MTLRAFVVGVVIAIGAFCSEVARAADLPMPPAVRPVPPVAFAPAPVPIHSWSGFYVGGNVGWGFDRSSWSDPLTGVNNNFTSPVFSAAARSG